MPMPLLHLLGLPITSHELVSHIRKGPVTTSGCCEVTFKEKNPILA